MFVFKKIIKTSAKFNQYTNSVLTEASQIKLQCTACKYTQNEVVWEFCFSQTLRFEYMLMEKWFIFSQMASCRFIGTTSESVYNGKSEKLKIQD